jgi:hypothetical protein
MEDTERTAIESEISTEKTIISDAEKIIAADEARLAAGQPLGGAQLTTIDAATDQPIETVTLDPDGKLPSTAIPFPTSSEAAAPADAIRTVDVTAEPLRAEIVNLTPMPDNGPLVPIDPNLPVAEIVAPEPQPWPYRDQPPSMGRIVHYHAASDGEKPDGNDYHAAMITKVAPDWTVSLSVFPEGRNPMFVTAIGFDGEGESSPGTWCWPPRV